MLTLDGVQVCIEGCEERNEMPVKSDYPGESPEMTTDVGDSGGETKMPINDGGSEGADEMPINEGGSENMVWLSVFAYGAIQPTYLLMLC